MRNGGSSLVITAHFMCNLVITGHFLKRFPPAVVVLEGPLRIDVAREIDDIPNDLRADVVNIEQPCRVTQMDYWMS
jgi:hypothetical protein